MGGTVTGPPSPAQAAGQSTGPPLNLRVPGSAAASTAASAVASAAAASRAAAASSAAASAKKGKQDGSTTVPNDDFNEAMFEEFKRRTHSGIPIAARDVRKLITNKTLPPLPFSKVDGKFMCLAWHVKGMCNSKCGRICDHTLYTAAEYQEMEPWCTAHYPQGN